MSEESHGSGATGPDTGATTGGDAAPATAGPPDDPVEPATLVAAREERLDAYLDARDLAAVWFATPNGFRWAAGGGTNVVSRDGGGVAALGYVDGDWHLVADNIEADRIATDEAPDPAAVHEFQWYEGGLRGAVADASPAPAAADVGVPGLDALDPVAVRQPLAPADVDRYRALGRTAADVVESVCRGLAPTETERAVAADLHAALEAHDLATPVVLVGGDERARRYRHFTPKPVELGEYAVVSVTVEWKGLYASLTRTVSFGGTPDWLAANHERCTRVETSALAATRAAGRAGEAAATVFGAVADAYERLDVPGEWREHHQGGATGYAGREWFLAPDADVPVELPGAFAYNPTVQGAKSEDTAIVTTDGIEVVTRTGEWPAAPARAVDDGTTLERHGVLELDERS